MELLDYIIGIGAILIIFFIFYLIAEPSNRFYTYVFNPKVYCAFKYLWSQIDNLNYNYKSGIYILSGDQIIIHIYSDFTYIRVKDLCLTSFHKYYWDITISRLSKKFIKLIIK